MVDREDGFVTILRGGEPVGNRASVINQYIQLPLKIPGDVLMHFSGQHAYLPLRGEVGSEEMNGSVGMSRLEFRSSLAAALSGASDA